MDRQHPSLDTKNWGEWLRIWVEFFQKTVCSNLVVHAKSVIRKVVKLSGLEEEPSRRLIGSKVPREYPTLHLVKTFSEVNLD